MGALLKLAPYLEGLSQLDFQVRFSVEECSQKYFIYLFSYTKCS